MTREWWNAVGCFAGCGFLVLVAAAFVPQPAPPRPPLPDALEPVAWLSPRVDRLAYEVERARRVVAADRAVLLAETREERRRARRQLIEAWSGK